MTTNQKGAIAETAIVHAAVKLGIGVLKPISEQRYDLVFDLEPRLVRVQCKWAVRKDNVVMVRCRSSRRARSGIIHRPYTPEEIDAFAAYCAGLDQCYFVPVDRFANARGIVLRLAAARNNQRRGVNWAEEYEFERLNWAALGP